MVGQGRDLRQTCALHQTDRHWRDPSLPHADGRRTQGRGAVGSDAGDADRSVRRGERQDEGDERRRRNRRTG